MRLFLVVALCLALLSCKPSKTAPKPGIWRGIIELQGQQLPFTFRLENDSARYKAYLRNGSEEILLDEISVAGDSIDMTLHIFDADLKAVFDSETMTGYFVKNFVAGYKLPFHAQWGDDWRFEPAKKNSDIDFSGKYSVTFIDKSDSSSSVGIFTQKGTHVEGTFLNVDGDYRYLEGNVINGKMWLSTFDGHHLYIFSASQQGNMLSGDFWSGKSHHEIWTAVKNPDAQLANEDSLTFLKKGFDKLDFSFPGLDGKKISASDERFKGKVLILQIFGTWCPNCMDETKYLSRWYKKNKDRQIEILGLAYEAKDDFNYAVSRVNKMREKLDVEYDFVIAGTYDKKKASESLPALNRVLAFPTTIFIGKDGKVKRIQTGFTGPGTGVYYEEFIQHFNDTVNELLDEKLASTAR